MPATVPSTANRITEGTTDVLQLLNTDSSTSNIFTLTGINEITGGEGDLYQVVDANADIDNDTGAIIDSINPNKVYTARSGIGRIDFETGGGDDTLNIDFDGAFYPIPLFIFDFGINENNRGLRFSGGEGNDTLNLNGGDFNGLDFYNSNTDNRTIRFDTNSNGSLYAQYFDLENIYVNPTNPLNYLNWEGGATVGNTENITVTNINTPVDRTSSAGRVLITSDVTADVEAPIPNSNFGVYGGDGLANITINTTEELVSGSGSVGIYGGQGNSTINLNNTNPLINGDNNDSFNDVEIEGDDNNDTININGATIINGEDNYRNELSIDGGDGDDTINIANSATLIIGNDTDNLDVDIDGNGFADQNSNDFTVDGGDGNNIINILGNAGLIEGDNSSNAVEINGGESSGSNSTITVGSEVTAGSISPSPALITGNNSNNSLRINGGEGDFTIDLNNTGDLINSTAGSANLVVLTGGSVGAEGSSNLTSEINVNSTGHLASQSADNVDADAGINLLILDGGEGSTINSTINFNNSTSLIDSTGTGSGTDSGGNTGPVFGVQFNTAFIDGGEGDNITSEINLNNSASFITSTGIDGGEGALFNTVFITGGAVDAEVGITSSTINSVGAEGNTISSTINVNNTASLISSTGNNGIGAGINLVIIDGGEGDSTSTINSTINVNNSAPLISSVGTEGGFGSAQNLVIIDGGEGGDASTINITGSAPLIVGANSSIQLGSLNGLDSVNLNHQTGDIIPDLGLNIISVNLNQNTPITGGEGNLTLDLIEGEGLFDQNNTYTGQTILNRGVLNISTATALGTTDGNTIVNNDGEIDVVSSITVAEALELDGKLGIGGGGLNVTWSGNIVLTDAYPSLYGGEGNPPIIEARNAADILDITGAITGTTGVDVVGAGKVIFNNASYTGTTNINEGVTLQVSSDISGSTFEVNEGTLTGTGTVGAVNVDSGATLSPGNSPGVINTGNLLLSGGSNLNIEVNGTTLGTQYDQVNVTGTVKIVNSVNSQANLNITKAPGFNPAVNDAFTIINNDGSDTVVGTFAGLGQGATVASIPTGSNNLRAIINYQGGDGNDVVITIQQFNVVNPPTSSGGVTTGSTGNDVINVLPTSSTNRVNADAGNDYIIGSNQTDNLFGGAGNDSLFGNGGIDNLRGGADNDLLNGGADNLVDNLYGEAGADLYVINPNNKKDNIFTFNPGEGDRFQLEGGLTFGDLAFKSNLILFDGNLLAKVYSSTGTATEFTAFDATLFV